MIDPDQLRRLQAIGLKPALLEHLMNTVPAGADAKPMRVTEVQREGLRLHDGSAEHGARALPSLTQRLLADDDALAVGDWVLPERNAFGEWWVHTRLPPLTQIARRLHDGRDKVTRVVIVSNVDTALLVMGLDNDFHLRRLERYLALVRLAGVSAVVVLTKADLCAQTAARLREAQSVVPADVPVVALNACGDEPREALAAWLDAGRTLVMLGSSGVGKSTLTNALIGHAVQDTGGNRRGDDRGRHTTTSRSLHQALGGACIIDTPGLRTLRLDSEAGDLAAVFSDIAGLAPQCRFRDCRHENEPGCAVREVVPAERLRSFNKLMREAQRDTISALERKQIVSQWKARGRAARARINAKRGA